MGCIVVRSLQVTMARRWPIIRPASGGSCVLLSLPGVGGDDEVEDINHVVGV